MFDCKIGNRFGKEDALHHDGLRTRPCHARKRCIDLICATNHGDRADVDAANAARKLNLLQEGLGEWIRGVAPTRRSDGSISRNSSTLFAAVSGAMLDSPVILPPGRARLATRPVPTGSPTDTMTIGIDAVASFAASAQGVKIAAITSTRER